MKNERYDFHIWADMFGGINSALEIGAVIADLKRYNQEVQQAEIAEQRVSQRDARAVLQRSQYLPSFG